MSIFEKFVKVVQPWIFAARYPGLKVRIEPETKALFDELRQASAIVCPNHCRHEDGELLFLISILVKQQFKFLAAREMFDSYFGFGGVVLRQLGCFQVDRGGDNSDAIRATEHQLIAPGAKVVIFPEGEIGYDNDRLESLEPGAAAIALDTFIRLQHRGEHRAVYILPVALSYQYDETEKVCSDLLLRLESKLGLTSQAALSNSIASQAESPERPWRDAAWQRKFDAAQKDNSASAELTPLLNAPHTVSFHDRARRICEAYLDDKERELENWMIGSAAPDSSDIDARVDRVFSASLQRIGDLVDYKIPDGTDTHRLHHLQSRIFIRKLKAGFLEKGKYERLDQQTILLNRLRSIKADELDGTSSLNSLTDLLCSLDVLITGRAAPRAAHTVYVCAAAPVDMSEYAEEWREHRESTVEKVTDELAARLQQKLSAVRSGQALLESGGSNLTLRNNM